MLLGPLQEHVDLAPGLVVARLLGEGDRVREDPRRLRGIPALEERPAEVAVGGGVRGIDPRGFLEGLDGLGGPAELEQRASEAEPEHGIGGVLLEEFAQSRGLCLERRDVDPCHAREATRATVAPLDDPPDGETLDPMATTSLRRALFERLFLNLALLLGFFQVLVWHWWSAVLLGGRQCRI